MKERFQVKYFYCLEILHGNQRALKAKGHEDHGKKALYESFAGTQIMYKL